MYKGESVEKENDMMAESQGIQHVKVRTTISKKED